MARRKDTSTMDLFGFEPPIEPTVRVLAIDLQAQCSHEKEIKTETEWPGYPGDPRWTWTCVSCGHYRGRCS